MSLPSGLVGDDAGVKAWSVTRGAQVLFGLIHLATYLDRTWRSDGRLLKELRGSPTALEALRKVWDRAVSSLLSAPGRTADEAALRRMLWQRLPAVRRVFKGKDRPILEIPRL